MLPPQFMRIISLLLARYYSDRSMNQVAHLGPANAGSLEQGTGSEMEGRIYNLFVGSWTGRSLPVLSGAGRGKSELRRAVCRITSGRMGSSPFDGKCHRKHTAAASLYRLCKDACHWRDLFARKYCGRFTPHAQILDWLRMTKPEQRRRGKGEKVR